MRILEIFLGGVTAIALANVLFNSQNTSQVISSTFSGGTGFYKTLITPGA